MAEGIAGNKRCRAAPGTGQVHNKHTRMIPKSGHRFSEKIMRKQRAKGGHMPTLGQFARAASALAIALGFGLAAAQAQDKGPIRIGFLPPITGPLASPGAEMVNGFRLFWEQAGMTAGGRKI